jgi:predicted transcriptional regulator
MNHFASECIMPTKKKPVSVRLDPKLAKRLEALAKETERSVSWHINRIVGDSITSVEEEVAAIKNALDQAKRGDGVDAFEFIQELMAKNAKGRRERKAG